MAGSEAIMDDGFLEEIIGEYSSECVEQLDEVEPQLLAASQFELDLANKLFRPMHSIKGASASLGFENIASAVHGAETLLSCFRSGGISTSDPRYRQFFLTVFDYIRKVILHIKNNKNDQICLEDNKKIIVQGKELYDLLMNSLNTSEHSGDTSTLENNLTEKNKVEIEKKEKKTATIVFEETLEDIQTTTPPNSPKHLSIVEEKENTVTESEEVASVSAPPPKEDETPKKTEKIEFDNITPKNDPPPSSEGFLVMGQDMLNSFKTESVEGMDTIEEALLGLSDHPDEKELVHKAYRAMHSFKGNCGIFNLSDFEKLGHKIETLFDQMRQGVRILNSQEVSIVVELVDLIRNRVSALELNDTGIIEQLNVYLDLIDTLTYTKNGQNGEAIKKAQMAIITSDKSREINLLDEEGQAAPPNLYDLEAKNSPPHPEDASSPDGKGLPPSGSSSGKGAPLPASNSSASSGSGDILKQNIRVDVLKLDILNNLVGELVTARTMLSQDIIEAGVKREKIERSLRFLERISTDLHNITLSIRMVPIVGLFKKLLRTVHDISIKSKKQVDFKYFGEDTEVDKTLLEKLSDPLVHMIRNAVDHGIEPAEERVKIGKPPKGQVLLSALHEAGEVWIVLKDDGRGLSRERIFAKAVEQGLLTEKNKDMSDQEIYQYIFKPGFSTAEKITDISGRGVGMDVVMQNIQSLKGRIEIQTVLGQGTSFTLKIPLTLAIIKGMLLQVGHLKFTLPIESIIESVKVSGAQVTTLMSGQQLAKIRNNMIPVVWLGKYYRLDGGVTDIEQGILVIVEGKGHRAALLVDRLLGQHEAVVRPMPRYFKDLPGISGCTILGNGDVGLILDTGLLDELVGTKTTEDKQ